MEITEKSRNNKKNIISFTLYPAYPAYQINQLHALSRTQQGRQREPNVKTFPTFCRILEAMRVEWQNSTPRFASTLERRNGSTKVTLRMSNRARKRE